jgi:3-hydroxyisobutyrate dehydrogenase
MSEKASIGFIGTGVMGRSMASHLRAAGHPLHVYNRSPEKAADLVAAGAILEKSVAALASEVDIVITIVGYPEDVEAVYLGCDGVVANAREGALLIDMTTSDPDLAVRIADAAEERTISALDAPVSGGDIGAREARLSIMVGGEKQGFERALPVLGLMGKNIVHQGPPGSGQHTKMCNQIAIAAGMVAVCESLAYAKAAGLDTETVLRSIESGAAGSWSLSNLAPRMLKGDFAPGFYVKHFLKDMRIALASAERLGLELPGLVLAKRLYDQLAAEGGAEDGTQALFRLFDAPSG